LLKLESLGVLSGGIAHDFNNLLTTILGNTNLGAMHLPPESPAMPYLHQVEQATLRAADLTRQLLAYAGKGRLQVAEVDLNRLVVEMTQLLTVSLSKKAVIRYDLASSLPFISADPSQMQQLVMNLVTNASEAIGDEVSGLITVRTGVEMVDDATQVGLLPALPLAAGEYVTLEVSDTGCGMAPEVRDRIFDPFYTTKFTGRGLGLSAMLGILRSHHGSLKVYSEQGRGSVFKLFLPALTVGDGNHSPGHVAGEWESHGVLLLVDDEPGARAVARELARSMGFQVLEAADGLEAVALFELRHTEITVVLMDLTMPHMDGRQAFLRMHQTDPKIPVVLTSGYSEQDVLADFLGKGLAGFLPKPYQRSQFQSILRQAVEG
jgi:CheY-like chemotaxis protein